MFRLRAAAACLVLLFAGSASATEPLRVVTSFSVLADIAARIGGERVAVTALVGAGSEPHAWSPRPQDVRRLAGADLVVVNGLGLEGWLDRLIAASGYEGPVLAASRGVTPLRDAAGRPDPHAWHSLANARLYAGAVAEALAALDPAGAAAFRDNLAAFAARTHALAAWAETGLAAIPPDRRILVTTHDAFAYLGRDLGITVLSPAGRDSAAQPSARRMAELAVRIRAAGLRAVFLEAGADPRLARTLAGEAGIAVGPPLFAGTLSTADGPAANYMAMWRHNVSQMLDSMGR